MLTGSQFFPQTDPFGGSRLRAHPTADVLGDTFTSYFEANKAPNSSVYDGLAASEWVATDRLDAETGQNFTSWAQFFGPHQYNGDLFTTVQRQNISSSTFDLSALGIYIYGAIEPNSLPQYYDAADIILLTDSLCNSACAAFVEMMHHEAGVRTVVAGGPPKAGPMQTASGSRGAQLYTADLIDFDIAVAEYLNATANTTLPDREVDTLITSLGINLRDQIRQDQPTTPIQFLYNAADCRIFYTLETWLNYTSLWTYAIDAIYTNPALCVPGSTGYASTKVAQAATPAPAPSSINSPFNASAVVAKYTTEFTGLELDSFHPVVHGGHSRPAKQTCNNHGNDCSSGRCNLDFKSPGKKGTYQGRTYTFRDGTCPSTSGGGGGLNDLQTEGDQPAETHGKRSADVELEKRMKRGVQLVGRDY